MDWDKLRIFHAVAEAGSFTHAGDTLHMSQSAISRQISSLEKELSVALFHRHARGLILTEQGELLYRTSHNVLMQLEDVKTRLTDSREKPTGTLRVTTTVGLGSSWLVARLPEFADLYPGITVDLRLDNKELDLTRREADVAIRLRQPVQPDLIQRKLYTVHFHVYASTRYINEFGQPSCISELDNHRIISFGEPVPAYLRDMNWLESVGCPSDKPRKAFLRVNNVNAIKRAVMYGVGIAALPDYLMEFDQGLVQLSIDAPPPEFDTYLTYPAELRNSARINAFRDFIIAKSKSWAF